MRHMQTTILHLAERLATARANDGGIDDVSSNALEHMISNTPATSIEEACVQIMLVLSSVAEIEDNEDREKNQRLLWSALNIMAKSSGLDWLRYGGEFYAPKYLDPWEASSDKFDAAVEAFEEAGRSNLHEVDVKMDPSENAAGSTPEQFGSGCAVTGTGYRKGSVA